MVMNSEFEVLVDKVALRLAKGMKPHRATLNKLYAYPIDSAFREHRLTARYKEFKAEIAERNKEIADVCSHNEQSSPIRDGR
jgi:uncharacterized protein (DUF1684 family)